MIDYAKGRRKINWFLCITIVLVIFSNIFSRYIENFFQLKPNIPETNATQVHFVDVGQGDSIIIKLSNGETMLVDSGTVDYRQKLKYYLDKMILKGSKTIDHVILTHPDTDHSSNMQYIIENYNVKTFYRPRIYEEYEDLNPSCYNPTYRSLLKSLKSKKTNVKFNDEIYINDGDLSVKALSIFEYVDDIQTLDTNEFSPAIIIRDENHSVMLTGDMTYNVEKILMENYSLDELNVDVLKLSHHGSKYSNSSEFLSVTSPEYVVAEVGVNTYGHPANDTLLRLLQYDEENHSNLYSNFKNTHDDGNVIYHLESKAISMYLVSNIDDYNFVSYFVYSIIIIIIIAYFLILPYFKDWKDKNKFFVRNRDYSKVKNK